MKRFSLLLILLFCFSSCHFKHKPNPERFDFGAYTEAGNFYKQGKYDKAIEKYQAYRDENPTGNMAVIADFYIAKSHAALGHKDQAKVLFEKISKEHADLPWANFSKRELEALNNPQAKSEKKS